MLLGVGFDLLCYQCELLIESVVPMLGLFLLVQWWFIPLRFGRITGHILRVCIVGDYGHAG